LQGGPEDPSPVKKLTLGILNLYYPEEINLWGYKGEGPVEVVKAILGRGGEGTDVVKG
jgi:hypothetical protein